ncbi:MAG: ABC transporter permease [Bacteroidota bacterium]|nr:ABC transporter permease [Bacteroidota bacterium]MDP3144357.1 ABC transporter permease [Bacteroidota bacterium]
MQQPKYHLRIEPKKSLFDINLKELWAYRDLIGLFVRRDFVSLYKQTILGPLWFIIQPLLSTAMFTIVFAKIAKFSTADLPPIVFYLSGTVAWNYFSTTLLKTSDTFTQNASIFGKVYFPRLTVPVSIVISNLIQFAIQFTLLAVIIIYYSFNGYDFHFDLTLLLIPVMLLILAGLGLGFGILISSLTTKYRDLKQLISFGVQLWMYITPIIFPLSSVSGKYRIFFLVNPLTGIIETFRTILLGVGQMNYFYLGYSAAFMVVLLVIGVIMFNRIERNFMDYV